MPKSLGRCLLKPLLKRAGITQTELARRIGKSPQMISHYANNRKAMDLETAFNIADVLDCSTNDLYERQ
jgi:putative transcriptional regulator